MKKPVMETLKRQWLELAANRRTRAMLIGCAILFLFVIVFRVYPVYEGMAGGETGRTVLEKSLVKYRQVVAGKAALEAGLTMLEKSLQQAETGLLGGETAALAAVDVQNTLNEIAYASGVEIQRMQVLKPDTNKQASPLYINVPVQFSVVVTIRQLKDILYKIETHPQFFLTLQWIRINTAGTREPKQIRCDMAVAGIMKNVSE